jgi:hypothetical protein
MPDTGLPWEIPYAAPADLVRDWPALSEDVADAVAAGLSAASNAGIGSNVVQTVKTNTFTTTSSSFTDVTDLEVTITPTSSSSLVLVLVQLNAATTPATGGSSGGWRLMRGATAIYIGDADGLRSRGSGRVSTRELSGATLLSYGGVFVDTPASSLAVTYGVEVFTGAGTLFVNRTQPDTNEATEVRTASSIVAIEVAP